MIQKSQIEEEKKEEIQKELPNFEPSGILAEYNNSVNGVVLKFTLPMDAAVPTESWRIYEFKGEETLRTIMISKQSKFLIGRDSRVCDLFLENPSISL